MKRSVSFFIPITLLLACLSILPGGCGGGTTGTGGTGSSDFRGYVFTSSGAPVSGAMMTIAETGDSAVTDQSGLFLITSELESQTQVTLVIETGTTSASTVISDLPADTAVDVQVDLQLNEQTKDLKVTKKKVTKKKKPTPTHAPAAPTPTLAPSVVPPTSAPGATPTDTPFPVQTDTPIPEDTPTPIPFDTPTLAPGEPTPTATPKPPTTLYQGRLTTTDPTLLVGTSIRVVGRAWKVVQPDGTFKFRIPAPDPAVQTYIQVRNGTSFGKVPIGQLAATTKSVQLELSVARRLNGSLKVLVVTEIIR